MSDPPNPSEAVRFAALDLMRGDLESGRGIGPLDRYLERFPGYADAVEAAWRQVAGDRAAEPGAPTAGGLRTDTALRGEGRVVGGYTLESPVAVGGQGVVWRARDALGNAVALKMLPMAALGSVRALERFRNESRITARLDLPGVAPVLGAGEEDGIAWIATRFVAGETLAAWIARQRQDGVDRHRAVGIVLDLLSTLEATHAVGVLHRDVKPTNVLLARDGTVVLVDFGLARDDASGAGPTRTGDRLGTPGYASPEQMRGQPVDARSDLYAVGVVLCEMLTGGLPYRGPELPHGTREPSRSAAVARLPRDLRRIVETAVAPDPSARYRTARTFAEDLTAWEDGRPLVHAMRSGPWTRVRRWVRREPVAALALGALLLVLSSGLAVTWRARDEAVAAAARSRQFALVAAARQTTPSAPPAAVRLATAAVEAGAGAAGIAALCDALDHWTTVRTWRGPRYVLGPCDVLGTRLVGARGRELVSLDVVSGREVRQALDVDVTAVRAADAHVLVGLADGRLLRLGPGAVVVSDDERVAAPGRAVLVVETAGDGTVWAGTQEGRVMRRADGGWEEFASFPAGVVDLAVGLEQGCIGIVTADDRAHLSTARGEIDRSWDVRPGPWVDRVAAADGGRAVATAVLDEDGTGFPLRFDFPTGRGRASFALMQGLPAPATVLRASARAQRFFVGCVGGAALTLGGLEGGSTPLIGHHDAVLDVDLSLDGRLLTACRDGHVRVWDTAFAQRTLDVPLGAPVTLARAVGEELVVAVTSTGGVSLHDLAGPFGFAGTAGRSVVGGAASGDTVVALDARRILVGTVADARAAAPASTFALSDEVMLEPQAVAVTADGRRCVVAGSDFRAFRRAEGRDGFTPDADAARPPAGPATSVAAFAPDGRLALGRRDGSLVLYRTDLSQAPTRIEALGQVVVQLVWAGDGASLAAVDLGGRMAVVARDGEVPIRAQLPPAAAARDLVVPVPDGLLAFAEQDGRSCVVHIPSNDLRAATPDPVPVGCDVRCAAARGGRVALGSTDGTVRVLSADALLANDDAAAAATARVLDPAAGDRQPAPVERLCWSADARLLAVARTDGSVEVHAPDADDGTPRVALGPADAVAKSMAFVDDGRALALFGRRHRLTLLPVRPAELAARVEARSAGLASDEELSFWWPLLQRDGEPTWPETGSAATSSGG